MVQIKNGTVHLVFAQQDTLTLTAFVDNAILDLHIMVMIVFAILDSLETEICVHPVILVVADVLVLQLVNVLLVLIFLWS